MPNLDGTNPILRLDGERLAIVRQLKGHTQVTLATAAKSSQAHISRLERGEANASPKMIRRLCDALGCDVAEIAEFYVAVKVAS